MDQNSLSILTVGSLAFDTIQTPSGKADLVLGGSGNYFSIAASFYCPVEVVGVVGEDFPKDHLHWLLDRKIDVSGIQVVQGKTFHWVGSYDQNMNEAKTLSTALNVFEHFNPSLSGRHKKAQYVFLANIDPVLQQSVLDQVESSRLVAMDSMNFWIAGKLDELKKTLKRVDILSLNEGEAYLLSEQKNILKAAESIQKMGPSVVIIKRGEYGAMLFTSSGIFIAPAFPVGSVIDPTGAGDSFAGAFMGYLAEAGAHREMARLNPQHWNQLLRRAVLAGCVMASFTVEDFSFRRLARLSLSELVERQTALSHMISLNSDQGREKL
ncbi:MAG: PfkB family carbohydrate kinase [Bdellovibrionia bacterium]